MANLSMRTEIALAVLGGIAGGAAAAVVAVYVIEHGIGRVAGVES